MIVVGGFYSIKNPYFNFVNGTMFSIFSTLDSLSTLKEEQAIGSTYQCSFLMAYKSVSPDTDDAGGTPRGAHPFPRDHQGQGSFHSLPLLLSDQGGEASTLKRQVRHTHTRRDAWIQIRRHVPNVHAQSVTVFLIGLKMQYFKYLRLHLRRLVIQHRRHLKCIEIHS